MTTKSPKYLGRLTADGSTWWAAWDGEAARAEGEALSVMVEEQGEETLADLVGTRFFGGGPEGQYHVWAVRDGLALIEDQSLFLGETIGDPASATVASVVDRIERDDPQPLGRVRVESSAALIWAVHELDVLDLPDGGSGEVVVGPERRWLWVPLENGLYELFYTAPGLRDEATGVEIDEVVWLGRT